MKVLYVTKMLPFGMSEAHILPEMASHRDAGWDIWIAPLQRGPLMHKQAAALIPKTFDQPLVSLTILAGAARTFISRPRSTLAVLRELFRSRSLPILVRNLAVFPKALWLSEVIRRDKFDHVHVHWAAAPATLAAVASVLSETPFSITAHRYDIAQKNLLKWKARNAQFVRTIDEAGTAEMREAAGVSPILLHVGVNIPERPVELRPGKLSTLRMIVGARFVEKKGMKYLISGIDAARQAGTIVIADLFGDGELEQSLKDHAQKLGLSEQIRFCGVASHEQLLSRMRSGDYDVAGLLSITGTDGDKEGIPVFLMEAIAAGLPTLTTPNGGILELAGNGRGLIVPERDGEAVGRALCKLANDESLRFQLATSGRSHVAAEFEVESCIARLRTLIGRSAPQSA